MSVESLAVFMQRTIRENCNRLIAIDSDCPYPHVSAYQRRVGRRVGDGLEAGRSSRACRVSPGKGLAAIMRQGGGS